MTLESLKSKISGVRQLLDSERLTDAMNELESISVSENNYTATDKLKKIRQTYGYMIHYFMEGMEDPSRKDVYCQTVESLQRICDDMIIEKGTEDSSNVFYSTLRVSNLRNLDFAEVYEDLNKSNDILHEAIDAGNETSTLVDKKDVAMRELFDLIWTKRLKKDTCNQIVRIVLSAQDNLNISSYIISALTLSLLEYYDDLKFTALLDIYENSQSDEVAARSLVAIVMVLYRHSSRISNDRKLMTRLELWQDSLLTYSRLRNVIKEIVRTRDTDRVAAKMRDEVIPELMKLKPDMLKKMRESAMDFESGLLENNPDWEDMLEKNGIASKMRELTEMQSEGADLMMVTFSKLKSFPFFNNVNAWFLPYDSKNSHIKLDKSSMKTLDDLFSMGTGMCDSDKYSLVLAISSMPEQQRQMMFGQFEMQMSQISEELKARLEKTSNPEFNAAATLFVRELYRFFKLFRKKDEFKDPFIDPFVFLELPVIGNMMTDDEILTLISEFYFKRGYYNEALSLFYAMGEEANSDPTHWEKIGYALQSLRRYDEALDAYQKASLLSEPSEWLVKRLAFVNKKLGNFKEAADYYARALEHDVDNVSLIMNSGNALLECGEIDSALRSYYHANYIDPENPKIWRAIAWGEFLSRKYEKSSSYYDKILLQSPISVDFLNAGHACLASGKIRDAINLYKQSSRSDINEFELAFRADHYTLINAGIDDLTQNLVVEAIKHDLS